MPVVVAMVYVHVAAVAAAVAAGTGSEEGALIDRPSRRQGSKTRRFPM